MILSLDIGSKSIHIVEGICTKQGLDVINSKQVILPDGCIEDGQIIDKSSLVLVLKDVLKLNGFKAKKAVVTLSSSAIIAKEIIIPKMDKKYFRSVLEQEMSPLMGTNENFIIDYSEVEELEEGKLKIHTLAVPTKMVEDYKRVLEDIGCKPYRMDIHQNVVSAIVKVNEGVFPENMLLVDLGNTNMAMYLIKDGKKTFARTSTIHSYQYEETLRVTGCLSNEEESFISVDVSPEAIASQPVLENTLSPYLNNIVSQIQSMIHFQLSIGATTPITEIYLCGGIAKLKGLTGYIEQNIYVPTYIIDEVIKSSSLKMTSIAEYTNALGMMISENSKSKKVNLFAVYHSEERKKKSISTHTTIGALALSVQVCLFLVVGGLMMISTEVFNRETEGIIKLLSDEELERKLYILHNQKQELNGLKAYENSLEKISEIIKNMPLINQTVFDEIASVMPSTVKVENLNYQGGILNLACQTTVVDDMATFVHYLRQKESIEGVNYTGYQYHEGNYSFDVQMVIGDGGEQDEAIK